jgi:hypothetical protein
LARGKQTVVSGGRKLVMVWGKTPPIFSIGYDEPMGPTDSGFSVLFDDAPDPDDVSDLVRDRRITWLCLHCLLEEHPEIGRGLDLARQQGAADLTDGGWIGRRVEPDG